MRRLVAALRRLVLAFWLMLPLPACFPGPLTCDELLANGLTNDACRLDADTTSDTTRSDADGMVATTTAPTDSAVADDSETTTDASVDGDAGPDGDTVGCVDNEACAHLDGPCASGICQVDGTCALVPRIGDCDDGDPCTKDDTCAGTTCAGTSYTCDDGLTCTTDRCDGTGGCLTQQTAASCLVAGACYAVGDRDPGDPCRVCVSGTTWSAADTGTCDDGDTCTTDDTCQAGACIGGPPPSDEGTDWIVDPVGVPLEWPSFGDQLLSNASNLVAETDVVRAFTSSGTQQWATSTRFRVLSLESDGGVWLGGPCDPIPVVNGVPVEVPSGSDPECMFFVASDGQASAATRLPARAHARFADGAVLGRNGTTLVRIGADGSEDWSVAFTLSVDGSILDAAIGPSGEVTAVARSMTGITVTNGTSLTVSGPGAAAAVRVRADGSIAWASPLYKSDDNDFLFDTARVAVHPSGEATVVGALFVRTATFGFGASTTEYTASGFYSLDPPEIGAGGDGYVARIDATGTLRWVRFLKPLHIYGSAFRSAWVDGDDVLVAGDYDESAVLGDGTSGEFLSDVTGAADPFLPRRAAVIAKYSSAGDVVWHAGHHGRVRALVRRSDAPNIQALLHLCEGAVGFGEPTPGALYACRYVVVSFNGKGGFECAR